MTDAPVRRGNGDVVSVADLRNVDVRPKWEVRTLCCVRMLTPICCANSLTVEGSALSSAQEPAGIFLHTCEPGRPLEKVGWRHLSEAH